MRSWISQAFYTRSLWNLKHLPQSTETILLIIVCHNLFDNLHVICNIYIHNVRPFTHMCMEYIFVLFENLKPHITNQQNKTKTYEGKNIDIKIY